MVDETTPAKIAIDPNPSDETMTESLQERIERLEARVAELREISVNDAMIIERVIAQLRGQETDYAPFPHGLAADHRAETAGLVPASIVADVPVEQPDGHWLWRWLGALRELGMIVRMYFDGRYRLSRVAQLAVPGIIGLMVLNYLFFAFWTVPILAPILERLLLVILAFVLYKTLARETYRYSAVLKYLSQYGR